MHGHALKHCTASYCTAAAYLRAELYDGCTASPPHSGKKGPVESLPLSRGQSCQSQAMSYMHCELRAAAANIRASPTAESWLLSC